ncbi:alpha/beta hydrolase [Gordonia sp. DT30]|uniref:alpha/beta hydrolase n=1 Tax=unclassified Gordonia (in: high G+C Gram-positive bacteria) TaxID=2657482 RepID=UPI003CEC82C4
MKLGLTHLREPVSAADLAATQAFYASRVGGVGPRTAAELATVRAARAVDPATPTRAVEEVVEVDGHRVPIRIITPEHGPASGVHLYLHGGGFYMDSAARTDAHNTRLADAIGAVVVGVDYRLAPESAWPAAPDDCETVARWLIDTGARRFGTTALTIGGMSAGSTLAMTTLLRLRDRGLASVFTGAVLEAGSYDLSAQTPSGRTIADEYFIEAYVGHVDDRTVADISPVFADLRDLPPALLVIGEDDVVLPDNLAMLARLVAAGNDVDLRLYPSAPHGFTMHPTPIGRQALRDIDFWLTQRLTHLDGRRSTEKLSSS